jgi:glycosyltransferase involved in cell wall biosynthesis
MNKIVTIFIITTLLILIGYKGLLYLAQPTFHPGTSPCQVDATKPKILLVCPVNGLGGGELHVVSLYKQLRSHQYDVSLLVGHNAALSHLLTKQDLPFYTTTANYFERFARPLYHVLMKQCLSALCAEHHFAVIHCNSRSDAPDVTRIAHQFGAKAIMTRHVPNTFPVEKIKGMDAVVGVTPAITAYMAEQNERYNLGVKNVLCIPAFFDNEKFANFQPKNNKVDFFKQSFSITINNDPILVMIANFYPDLTHKNHPLLFKAIASLVNQKHRPVQVLLAGDGEQKGYLMKLTQELSIDQCVHFLGFTDKIPELLYHADIMVHSASQEACAIIFLEAGAMKKPTIGSRGTGAEFIIVDGQTGLLFNNNDVDDLVRKIEQLLDKPLWTKTLGQNAYRRIMQEFSPAATLAKHEDLYRKVLNASPLA